MGKALIPKISPPASACPHIHRDQISMASRHLSLLDTRLKMENLNVFVIRGCFWFKIRKYSWDGAGRVKDSGKQRNTAQTQFWFNPSRLQCCSALPVMKFNLKATSSEESQEPSPWGTLLHARSPGRSQVHADRTNIQQTSGYFFLQQAEDFQGFSFRGCCSREEQH